MVPDADTFSELIKEDQSFGMIQSGGVALPHPQELKQIYNQPFPFF